MPSPLAPFARASTAIRRTPQQEQEYREMADAVNKEAKDNWRDQAWHAEVAQVIESTLDYGFTFDNPFTSYVDTQVVGEWDKVVIRERRGLKVFSTSRGGSIDESQLKREHWELPRDTMGFHVSEHEDKLRMNFSETMDDLLNLGAARMEAEVNRRFLSLLQTAIPSGSPQYVTISGAGLTKTVLDAQIDAVRDSIQPNGVGIQPVTVLGRVQAVASINDFNLGFDPEATAEIRARGRLGTYRGATIRELIHYVDENDASYMPANEVWVFSGNVGKFAMYGGMQSKSFKENTRWYWHWLGRRDLGGVVTHAERARRIVISGISA